MGMILICFVVALALLVGCGGDAYEARVEVIATTTIAADITARVAGPDARVDPLLSGSASPHDYGASAKDRARLEDADLVVAWGAGLEQGLPLGELEREPFELADGERDPHIWMDPRRVARSLPELAEALAEADPDHAAGYRRRAGAYARELEAFDRGLRRTLATIPADRRKLVTSHDSLGHFARAYRFSLLGAASGLAPESEPSAERVASLIERVEHDDVPAVFAEASEDPGVIEQIAREAGVPLVDDLLIEGFGGDVASYEGMLRHDAERIAAALTP
jgi:ABC-type Zn uptake system ZnuABC Zn-binding protein ZnuA